jgi:hypothetical protein
MKYSEAVTRGRMLVKRTESDQWELAQLTYERVEAGSSRREWARDIGIDRTHADALYKVWAEVGIGAAAATRPSFSEAYNGARWSRTEPERAKAAVTKLPPAERAELVREMLEDQEVADETVSQGYDALSNLSHASERRDHERGKRALDAVPGSRQISNKMSEQKAQLQLGQACSQFIESVNTLVPAAGRISESEKFWLAGSRDRVLLAVEILSSFIDGGTSTDAEFERMMSDG